MGGERKQIDGFGVGIMILLCAVWGLHQVAIKVAAPDIAPIMQIALRSGISAVLVAIVIRSGWGNFILRDGTFRPGIIVGILFAAEFLCIAEGLRFTSASHMAVFLYTAPVFTALGLHCFLPAEKLRPQQWLGIAIAFAGIATAFTGGSQYAGFSSRMLWGDFLGVLAGAGWGATTVIIRCTALSEAPPTKTLLYQLVAAFILLLLYAVCSGQAGNISMTRIAWASLLFQGVVITFASYLAWFWLLRRYLASRLAVFSFMSPLFGVSFGVILLHDSVDAYFAIGAVMVLAGITIVSRPNLFRLSTNGIT
ncbi:MAG: DMT family transporter [Desulfuromonadaceae bacterium]|nr:DMT family transporter [Desulfuromonadaceae bacterium]